MGNFTSNWNFRDLANVQVQFTKTKSHASIIKPWESECIAFKFVPAYQFVWMIQRFGSSTLLMCRKSNFSTSLAVQKHCNRSQLHIFKCSTTLNGLLTIESQRLVVVVNFISSTYRPWRNPIQQAANTAPLEVNTAAIHSSTSWCSV